MQRLERSISPPEPSKPLRRGTPKSVPASGVAQSVDNRLPTEEQVAILAKAGGSGNLMINALAGTGKTSTLEMIERATATRPVLFLAFNKKIADDAAKRMASTTTVRTLNSIGHRIWAKTYGHNLNLNPRKVPEILRGYIDEQSRGTKSDLWEVFWDIVAAVGSAKSLGYVPDDTYSNAKRLISRNAFHLTLDPEPSWLTAQAIDEVLTRSTAAAYAGTIDFGDQVYLPALFGGIYPQFPLTMVDEYQDLNPTNHVLISRLVGNRRLIGVGDPWQNIYGFRGAASYGMARAIDAYRMDIADLSVSFRCPRRVVEAVRWRVPHYKWIKDGGIVGRLLELNASDIVDGDAIICRNNAPLLRVAMHFLSAGRSVAVYGSDIGPRLIGQMRKIGPESATQGQFLAAIDDWVAGRDESEKATDTADCMRVFARYASTKSGAIAHAESLFAQKGKILLLTGHKAKGLEFDTVYHLDPWLCSDSEQDKNLRYVISTRTRDRLFEIDSARIKWNEQ